MTGIDCDPEIEEQDVSWSLEFSGISLAIMIQETEDEFADCMSIVAWLVTLPNHNLLPFYRRLLRMNSGLTGNALCLLEPDQVVLRHSRPLLGLEGREITDTIQNIITRASALIDIFVEEFDANPSRF